jgi:uncharacterized NAD(P)/FAD-binding protein YdhS
LRHVRPWWNIHRHRLPPDLHAGLTRAVATGQVNLVAGEFVGIERHGDIVRATIRPRGSERHEVVEVARVYDCGGVSVDVRASANPLIRQLVQSGAARPDDLHIGLDVDANCAGAGVAAGAGGGAAHKGPIFRDRGGS